MVTFTVHEPASPEADRLDRADELQFVKDGFSWLTALCPPLGLALNRIWLPLLAYIVAVAGIGWIFAKLGVDAPRIGLFVVALNLYLGFELPSLKRWTLDQGGWRMVGTVTGRSLAECERRFFESWLPAQPVIKSHGPASPPGRWAVGHSAPRAR